LAFLQHLFGANRERAALMPLYESIVAVGRDPSWYHAGVPDTLDGRFDMIAALVALVLLRLETEGEAGRRPSVLLTEIFVADMDSSLREIGIGDYVVGKHIGRMMGALGGRLGAFRDAEGEFGPPVSRNIFHEAPPSEEAVAAVAERLQEIAAGLARLSMDDILEGRIAL
jgi:cytochrome b pre-mRNA-processing protein 3